MGAAGKDLTQGAQRREAQRREAQRALRRRELWRYGLFGNWEVRDTGRRRESCRSRCARNSRAGCRFGGYAGALAGQHWIWTRDCSAADWSGETRDFPAGARRRGVAAGEPEITWRSAEKIVVWDACLSFLSIFMQVERHREIVVRYQDLQGEWKEVRAGEERDCRSCCSTRSIIWMGFWPWIVLRIFGRCAHGKSLKRDIGRGVLMRWLRRRVSAESVVGNKLREN